MKYALSLLPSVPSAGALPTATLEDGLLVMIYQRDTRRGDVPLHAATSDTLQSSSRTATGVTEALTGTDGPIETIRASIPVGSDLRKFLRLVATRSQ